MLSTPAAAHEPEEVQSKFFWGACFGNVRPFCSAAYRLPEIHGCQGTVLSWSLSILSVLLRRVLPTNVILQLICKRGESHPIFRPDFIGVQAELFEDTIPQGGGRIVADGGLNALPLVLQVRVWTSSPGVCSYKDFADFVGYVWGGSWGPVAARSGGVVTGFFWSTSNVFIPSTIHSLLFGHLWVWVSLGALILEFAGNGRHASYAIRYLKQGLQVTRGFGRATSVPWRCLCFRKSSCQLLNQHFVHVFTW